MICPCCKKKVARSHFSCHAGATAARGGAISARAPEVARAAAMARWSGAELSRPLVVLTGLGEPAIYLAQGDRVRDIRRAGALWRLQFRRARATKWIKAAATEDPRNSLGV